jgi:hypothetical protein
MPSCPRSGCVVRTARSAFTVRCGAQGAVVAPAENTHAPRDETVSGLVARNSVGKLVHNA